VISIGKPDSDQSGSLEDWAGVKTSVVLFTRDLRMHDHPALTAATRQSDRVVPAFVIDERLVGGRAGAPNRLAFLLESLRDLNRSLRERGSSLVIRSGDVVTEVMRLAGECTADAIFISEDVSGYARARMDRLRLACEDQGLSFARSRASPSSRPESSPRRAATTTASSPRTGGPGARRTSAIRCPPRKLRSLTGLRTGRLPKLTDLTGIHRQVPAGRRGVGRPRPPEPLASKRIVAVRGTRRRPARGRHVASQSVSALRLPVRQRGSLARRRAKGSRGLRPAACWRDFHHQVLAARPTFPQDYRKRDAAGKSQGLLDAWKEGQTAIRSLTPACASSPIRAFSPTGLA
jgi:deoxyribodipyrimidine photo-lyase